MTQHSHPYFRKHRISGDSERDEEDEEEDIENQEGTSYSFEDIMRCLPGHEKQERIADAGSHLY